MTIALNDYDNTHEQDVVFGGVTNRKKLTSLHIKALIDGTGSGSSLVKGTNAVLTDLVSELPKVISQVYWGLHVGKDLDYDSDADLNLGDDISPEEFQRSISLIQYSGGGDDLETQINSVREVAKKTAWKTDDGARLAIVLVTSSDSKNTPDGKTGADIGQECAALGVKVIVVCPAGANNVLDLATYSGGEAMVISNNPGLDDLRRLRSKLTKSLTQIAGSATPNQSARSRPFGKNGTVAFGFN